MFVGYQACLQITSYEGRGAYGVSKGACPFGGGLGEPPEKHLKGGRVGKERRVFHPWWRAWQPATRIPPGLALTLGGEAALEGCVDRMHGGQRRQGSQGCARRLRSRRLRSHAVKKRL